MPENAPPTNPPDKIPPPEPESPNPNPNPNKAADILGAIDGLLDNLEGIREDWPVQPPPFSVFKGHVHTETKVEYQPESERELYTRIAVFTAASLSSYQNGLTPADLASRAATIAAELVLRIQSRYPGPAQPEVVVQKTRENANFVK